LLGVVPLSRSFAIGTSAAIRDELGFSYIVQTYLEALLPFVFVVGPLLAP
jgi:hypothetical protein